MCPGCGGEEDVLFKLENGKKKDMISCSLVYVCSKDEVCLDTDEPISYLIEK